MKSARMRVLVLALTDMLCVSAVLSVVVLGYWFFGGGDYAPSDYLVAWPILPLFVFLNSFLRLYHGNPFYPSMPVSQIEEFRRLVGSSFSVHILAMAVLGFRHEAELVSRFVLLVSAILVALFAQPLRNLARRIMSKLNVCQIKALIVGETKICEETSRLIANDSHLGFEIFRFNGDNHDIVKYAQALQVRILITCQDARLVREEMVEFLKWFQHIVFMPEREVFPILGSKPVIVNGVGGLEMVNQRRIKGLMIEKRLVDSFLAIVIGIVTLPLFLIIPILIKLTSKGPVFYRAKRLGKGGRPIQVLKFRSMYQNSDKRLSKLLRRDPEAAAEWEKSFKLKDDPRITWLGKFMRKTSIDELPQLWNVMHGEMALVGPRPIVEQEIAYYGADYEIFSLAKPGITGLWQTSGRSDLDYAQRVALDKFYVLNWTPWMDFWIVIRTIAAVFGMKGSR